jgi:hypothetical protein
MRDLAGELPAVGALEEYGLYLARLDEVEARPLSGVEVTS